MEDWPETCSLPWNTFASRRNTSSSSTSSSPSESESFKVTSRFDFVFQKKTKKLFQIFTLN